MGIVKRFFTLIIIAALSLGAWGDSVVLDYEGTGSFPRNSGWQSGGTEASVNHTTGGSYCAAFAVNGSAYITYNSSLTNVSSISLWGERTSNNTTHPSFAVEGSTDGGTSWSTLVAASTFSLAKNSWTEKVISISPAFTGMVRLKYSCTTTAIKYIDDITITYSGSTGTDPTITFNDGNYTIGGAALNLSTLFSSNSSGDVTYTVKNANGTGASISGTNFTATTAGTCTVQAAQAASGKYNAKTVTATITVTNAPINVTLNRNGATEVINNVSVGTALDDIDGEGAQGGCDAWTFVGWSKSQRAAQNNSTPMDLVTTVDNSGPYYAVYRNGDGTSVNFDPSTDTSTSTSLEKGGITISTTNGSFSEGTDYRIYKGATFTINAGTNIISSITLSYSSSSYDGGGWPTSVSPNTTTWSRTATSGSSGEQARITSLSVTAGTVYYSTTASCAPKVQATASPWVTSTQGATVKVEVPVTATNFDASCTLSASVSGGFSIVGWGANGNSVTAGEDLTTSLILEYSPTVFNSDATITFNSTYSGSQTPVYTPGTVHGRSLPGLFVIAIKNGGTWYALPADMSGSGTYAGVAVDVDDIDNPTKVTAGPATALYRLMGVHPGRYDDYGTRVRFMSEYNSKCLWSNAANNGTGINNGAIPLSANSDNYEWTLVTTDGVTYAINTNVAKKIEEGRELRYYAGESRFGMYASGNNSFRFLPVDCDNRATVTATATTYNSITLTWTGKSGTNYNVYIDEGGVTKKTETNVTSPVTISGLSPETYYTWIISPGDKDNDCALSGDFTTNVAPINVTLSCDGTEYHLGPQDKPYTLPTSGVYVNDACTEWTFEGWTTNTHSKSTSKPTLIDQVSTDGTVYAVYKHTDGGGSTAYTLTIHTSDFESDGYAGTLNDIDAVADDDNTNTMSVSFNKSNAGKVGSVIQFKSNGYIYNTTELGSISSISTNNSNIGYYINSTENPSSAGSGGYFKLYAVSSIATSNTTSSIDIHFTKSNSTTYYATSSECCNEVAVPTVVVEPVDVSATISWDNQLGATNGYHITCSNGTDQDVAAGVTSLVISGLSASTSYDYTVTAKGATCNRTFEGSFTTSSCSDVPTDVIVTPGTHTANIRWTASAATATIVIYDDEQGTSIVTSVANQTSPCTISGLNDNTNYYLQVLAGGSCPLPTLKPFTTQSTAVSIAEWFPDGININLNADEATATVLIEDKQEQQSSSTSYADGLFFSKYYEAYLSVKLWAIYNGTNEKISLANVKVKSANNGNYWAKDNTTGTGAENNGKITLLDTCGHFERGYIYPGEEIIVYNPGQASGTQDHNIIECMEATYGTAYKNDPDSVWYLVNNQTTSISGDDGLLLLDGTDTLDVIGGKNTSAAYAAISQPSWGDAKGWNDSNGTDEEGNVIGLSTNRCLLVRKNTVKNGLNAVEKNTTYFNTISEEWWGAHVPTDGDQIQSSCDNFSYVGHYDYNQYYAHFDSITTVDELTGKKNDDGTFTIPIPQLDTLSCTMLRVKVYEGTEEKTSAEYKVPIMVEGSKMTNDEVFKKHEVPTCKECDVVILKNAILEKTNGANDRDEVRNLTIYPGGKLVVPSGKGDYTVQSVQFRVENENAPLAKLIGNLITKDEQVIVSRRIKNDRYYFFSLPYDCNIADIHWANGEPATIGVDYQIVEYDGARRANEGSGSGVTPHWTPVSGTQLKAGVGYNIAVSSSLVKELIFPMAIGGTNLTNIENTKTAKTVAIHQYTNAGTTINNHNWNLVAHPYVSAFEPYSGDKITAGILEYTEPASPGEQGTWEIKNTSNVYLTMPSFNNNAITYTQTLAGDITSLDPFLAVFVQGAGEGDLTFEQTGRKLSASARHLAAAAEDEDESIFVGVTLSGNGESDQTCVRIRPDFTDEYQLGYDLDKFVTFYTSRPQVYMKTPSYRLAFQAVSDEVAKSSFLPMGVYCYQAGTYTFALNERFPTDEVEAVYLFDKQTGVTTNLLYDTYSFSATKQVYTNTRFSLNVIVNRRAPQTATGMETTHAPNEVVRKILINGHVYIQRGGVIYDVTGKQMLNHK